MVRMLAAGLALVLLTACSNLGPRSDHLEHVQYNHISLFANYELNMDIAPDGTVGVREQSGINGANFRQARGALSEEQRQALNAVFQGWDRLKATYPSDVTPIYQITYNDYKVTAGSPTAMPPEFKRARDALDQLAKSLLSASVKPQSPGSP